jgi:acyl carrier protein
MFIEKDVKNMIIEVLKNIQRVSGYESESISGTTNPFKDLEGFDSQISVAAICELSTSLDIDIPDNANIFLSGDGKRRLTIDEIAGRVCKILNK